MDNYKKLSDLKKGEVATVVDIQNGDLRSKLLEFGFTTGSKVSRLYDAPFGDPIAVRLEGFDLSMRRSEAALISISN